jgi:hypothetical protein
MNAVAAREAILNASASLVRQAARRSLGTVASTHMAGVPKSSEHCLRGWPHRTSILNRREVVLRRYDPFHRRHRHRQSNSNGSTSIGGLAKCHITP